MNRHQRRAWAVTRSKDVATALKALETMSSAARENEGSLIVRVVCGWSFNLSLNLGQKAPDGSGWWHLSAMLVPEGRSSVDDDWIFLGRACRTIGLPTDPKTGAPITPVTPFETTPPNDIHHWTWAESGIDVAAAMKEALRAVHPERSN